MQVYLTNLSAYTRGELIGNWVNPADCDWEEELKKIGIGKENRYGEIDEEYFITDYENAPEGLGESESLDRLTKIAEYCDGDDGDVFMAITEMEDIDTAMKYIDSGDYCVHYLGNSFMDEDAKLGYSLIDDGYLEIPTELENYFDYEAYGRDFRLETVGDFTTVDGHDAYIELY